MIELSIRRATAKDAEELSEMICGNARKTLLPHYSEKQWQIFQTYYSVDVIREKIETQDFFCTLHKEKVVGSVALHNDWLVGFYTHVHYLGKGIGSALMNHIESVAREKGLTEIQLAASPVGLDFYLKKGWEKIKDIVVNHYGVDFEESLMVKKLK